MTKITHKLSKTAYAASMQILRTLIRLVLTPPTGGQRTYIGCGSNAQVDAVLDWDER